MLQGREGKNRHQDLVKVWHGIATKVRNYQFIDLIQFHNNKQVVLNLEYEYLRKNVKVSNLAEGIKKYWYCKETQRSLKQKYNSSPVFKKRGK